MTVGCVGVAVPLMVLARRWRVCLVALLRLAVMAFTAAVVGVISIGSVVVVLRRWLLIWPAVWVTVCLYLVQACKNPVSGKRSFDFGTYGNIVPWIKRGGFQLEAPQTTRYWLRYSLSKFR